MQARHTPLGAESQYTQRVPNDPRLLQRLRSLVLSEAETQHYQLERQWKLPIGERVRRGFAIEGLRLQAFLPGGAFSLACQSNDSRFREGDFLVLHRGDPQGPESMGCVLEYDDETQLELSLQDGEAHFLQSMHDGWIADEGGLDLTPFYLDALDEAADSLRGRSRILPLLSGALGPTIDYARYQRAWEAATGAGLDEAQAEAAAQAYATDLVHLVQGPPGSGKTLALAHMVRLLVEDGQRVLVSALTHRAINNALNKIAQVDPALPVCKIGRETRARDLVPPNYGSFSSSGFGDLPGGYAVGATPFATRSERLSNVEFDVVIFDEASQITLPLAIMGMLSGARFIFIGDERQLPPVSTLRNSELARTSIFAYLNGRGFETLLTTTYRMNDVLTAWPSRTFYEGALHPAPGVAERRLKLRRLKPGDLDPAWEFALDPERPAVFLDLGHRNTTVRSRREAETVCELVLALLQGGLPAAEIGVVAPYRAQGRLIRNLLRAALPERELLRELAVDTVERMQGQEREAVLISLTTSSPGFAAQLADFFFQPERLNVAVTRPRTKLILIGSRHVLQAAAGDPQVEAWVDLLRDLLDQCAVYTLG